MSIQSIMSKVKRGDPTLPPRLLISGVPGLGKTTLASKFPNPLFISPEDGLRGFDHIERLAPTTFQDVLDIVKHMTINPTDYKTLVFDTTDHLERLLFEMLCDKDGVSGIEKYDGGFGKGYQAAEQELNKLLKGIDELRHAKKITVVMLSHVSVKPFTDPRGQAWDRFILKGQQRLAGLLHEWCDACLFGAFDVFQSKKDGVEKAIAGERMLHTEWSPAFDAKNRLNLPSSIKMDYDDLAQAISKNSVAAIKDQLIALYSEVKPKLTPELTDKWEKGMAAIDGMTADRLRAAIDKLKTLNK